MARLYLQVEAVNLDHTIFDTHDLSTIRGGSFSLLDAIEQVARIFRDKMECITNAAGEGLFVIEDFAGDDAQITTLVLKILTELKIRAGEHATFLIATEISASPVEEEDFPLVLERLKAQIRRQQWRMPTVAVPAGVAREDADAVDACFLDGWRPAVVPYRVDPEQPDVKISTATDFRRQHGRIIKDQIFSRLLGEEYKDDLCARDLNKLASHPGMGLLSGKIALIHVDGNSFGSIRRALCHNRILRREFDQQIQEQCRVPFLRTLLEMARKDKDFQAEDDEGRNALRIEVLLWGGDEMTLVVPAWRGWQTVDLYFQHARRLHFAGYALSHRAAIVFCHHNAPILQIRRLANDLLDRTRDDLASGLQESINRDQEFEQLSADERQRVVAWKANHRLGDALHYLSLKSFDMLGGSMDSFLDSYYAHTDYGDLLVYADELAAVRDHLKTLHAYLPKGKLREIAVTRQRNDSSRLLKLESSLFATVPPEVAPQVAHSLAFLTNEKPGRWQLITDLWDFVEEWQ